MDAVATAASEPEGEQQQAKEPTITELMEKMKADLQADFDKKYKSQIAGLDRKNQELAKELESEKVAHMKAEERREYEAKQREQALAERESAIKQRDIDFHKMRLLAKYGLDEGFMPRIQGETPEALEEDIKSLKSYITDKFVNPEVNTRLASGPKPAGGSGQSDTGNLLTMEKYVKMKSDELRDYQKSNPKGWSDFLAAQPKSPGVSN